MNKLILQSAVAAFALLLAAQVHVDTVVAGKVAERELERQRRKKQRVLWVRPFLLDRQIFGNFTTVFAKLMAIDEKYFFNYVRMTKTHYFELLDLVKNDIEKRTTKLRKPVSPEERLVVTLRFLSTGESQRSLSYQFRLGRSTVSEILSQTCLVIWKRVGAKFIPKPTQQMYAASMHKFWELWNFPNCFGSIDGKHVRIMCPPKSGSDYFNYKKYYSLVLLGVCDAEYRFLMVDVGAPGRLGDSSVFPNSTFGRQFLSGTLDLPEQRNLPGTAIEVPPMLIGDDAFPLKPNLMKPYGGNLTLEQRIFNYRLSRARRIIENTFGILVARWRVLKTEINCSLKNTRNVILACCSLHNFLQRDSTTRAYCPPSFVDGESPETHEIIPGDWRAAAAEESLDNMATNMSNRYQKKAGEIRDELKNFFCSEAGAVPWQFRIVTQTAYK